MNKIRTATIEGIFLLVCLAIAVVGVAANIAHTSAPVPAPAPAPVTAPACAEVVVDPGMALDYNGDNGAWRDLASGRIIGWSVTEDSPILTCP